MRRPSPVFPVASARVVVGGRSRTALRRWMTRQDRIVAGITLAHASLGMAWTFWLASRTGATDTRFLYDVVLASGGIAAGAGWFRGRYWAGFVAFAYYLVQ